MSPEAAMQTVPVAPMIESAPIVVPMTDFGYDRTGEGYFKPDDFIAKDTHAKVEEILRRDPRIATYLAFRKYAVLSGGWEIVPMDDSPEAVTRAEHFQWCLDHVKGSPRALLLGMLSGLENGFYVGEKVWRYVEDGDYAGTVTLDRLAHKNPAHFDFDQDEFGRLKPDGLIQFPRAKFGGQEEIRHPIDRFVIWTRNERFGNLMGQSILAPIFDNYFARNTLPRHLRVAAEKGCLGLLWAKTPAGFTQTQNAALVARMKKAHGAGDIVTPDGVHLEFVEFPTQNIDAVLKILERDEKEIASGLQFPELLMQVGANGNYEIAAVHRDTAETLLTSEQEDISDTFNEQIVAEWARLNYGEGEPLVRLMIRPVNWSALESMKTKLEMLKTAGLKPAKDRVAEDLGYAPDDIEDAPEPVNPFGAPSGGKQFAESDPKDEAFRASVKTGAETLAKIIKGEAAHVAQRLEGAQAGPLARPRSRRPSSPVHVFSGSSGTLTSVSTAPRSEPAPLMFGKS